MINWKKSAKAIPNKVQIDSKTFYEVLWTNEFADEATLGEMRMDKKQIVINTNQSAKEQCLTLFHEFIHAVSDEHKIGLTETQVSKLEKHFYYLLKSFDFMEKK